MVPFRLHEIACFINAKCVGSDVMINTISIHSDLIEEQCIFIALIGNRYDGHDFVEQAVMAGAKALLVNRYVSLDIPQLIVCDTRDALLKIAGWIRRQVSSKIIAITGSSGKTSVKEMTASILKECGTVIATQKNYNNFIGVSITLLKLTYGIDFAVVELGSNKLGELKKLGEIVGADVALVNNIFSSHLSGFGSLTTIKKEKEKIFYGMSIDNAQAVINLDSYSFVQGNSILLNFKKKWSFSLYKKGIGVNFFASNVILYEHGIRFTLHSPNGSAPIFMPILGIHNISNILAASALSFAVGASLSNIVHGLQKMNALPGRLFPFILNRGKLCLIDDTYNANIGSMIAAINVLSFMPGYRILVVSDMLELGDLKMARYYHCYIGRLILGSNIDYIITIGDLSHFILKIFKKGKHFQRKTALIFYINKILSQNRLISILIKGARKFKMEQVVDAVRKTHDVVIR
ncbi:UDP-N-acetylmuramoyl-tripeptide--D-alanyl-D-alanine ligase [Candidatus Blochmanniella vafra str. BVAF]|uniref:UDP-N-acetylmuramoyl-tripeptide--D-alanyl-D-alanine ligase n=1 Tax=Blochmanniella vafra (strain BVAF) TaxID=859654 RepID=E8Q5P9_BLOVB|nr:UDP-N-acetylmuramoyl-tripeptide--D-alanyl-D-alanine ligase [Candidatus Blochmannia vafer]ADV33546.1 UDP-N-acetylmuramoyl-tripeptide--D-alanyl-D-alanine ligase [Candidatus Blochmannia vafer str. BVAF]